MRQQRDREVFCRPRGPVVVGFVMAGLLVGTMGLDCDSDAAAVFREHATSSIAQGVKTIMDAVIDGVAAAIEEAGDGSSSSS